MTVRILGFGDLSGGPWGAAWIPSEVGQGALLGSSGGLEVELTGDDPGAAWQLTADATELTLEGVGDPAWTDRAGGAPGFDQLCEVTGVLSDQTVSALGWRSARPNPLTSGRQELRQVAAWFERDDGFALMSVRPDGRRGHEEDQVIAAQFGPAGSGQVVDPRLSTTYTGAEEPSRASVELWIESEEDSEAQYPRRAIGEALAAPAQARAGEIALHAQPFRWYGGGRDGAGLYLLGRVA